jgi:hypothetical protein
MIIPLGHDSTARRNISLERLGLVIASVLSSMPVQRSSWSVTDREGAGCIGRPMVRKGTWNEVCDEISAIQPHKVTAREKLPEQWYAVACRYRPEREDHAFAGKIIVVVVAWA